MNVYWCSWWQSPSRTHVTARALCSLLQALQYFPGFPRFYQSLTPRNKIIFQATQFPQIFKQSFCCSLLVRGFPKRELLTINERPPQQTPHTDTFGLHRESFGNSRVWCRTFHSDTEAHCQTEAQTETQTLEGGVGKVWPRTPLLHEHNNHIDNVKGLLSPFPPSSGKAPRSAAFKAGSQGRGEALGPGMPTPSQTALGEHLP